MVRPKWYEDMDEVQPLPEAEDLERHRCVKTTDRPSEVAENKSHTSPIRQRLPSSSHHSRSGGRASSAVAEASISRGDEESGASRRWRRGLKSLGQGRIILSHLGKNPLYNPGGLDGVSCSLSLPRISGSYQYHPK